MTFVCGRSRSRVFVFCSPLPFRLTRSTQSACDGKSKDVKQISAAETIDAHRAHVTALAFSEDATMLCSGGADHCVIVWRLKRGLLRGIGLQELWRDSLTHVGVVTAVAFGRGPSAALVFSGSWDASVWCGGSGGWLIRSSFDRRTLSQRVERCADGQRTTRAGACRRCRRRRRRQRRQRAAHRPRQVRRSEAICLHQFHLFSPSLAPLLSTARAADRRRRCDCTRIRYASLWTCAKNAAKFDCCCRRSLAWRCRTTDAICCRPAPTTLCASGAPRRPCMCSARRPLVSTLTVRRRRAASASRPT